MSQIYHKISIFILTKENLGVIIKKTAMKGGIKIMSAKLKVMSFNLRVEAPAHDGINDLPNRKGRILDAISTEAPDLIGFQEARDGTRAWLRDTLSDYVVVGCGRYAEYRGESAPLAFRKDKFEMVSMVTTSHPSCKANLAR